VLEPISKDVQVDIERGPRKAWGTRRKVGLGVARSSSRGRKTARDRRGLSGGRRGKRFCGKKICGIEDMRGGKFFSSEKKNKGRGSEN